MNKNSRFFLKAADPICEAVSETGLALIPSIFPDFSKC